MIAYLRQADTIPTTKVLQREIFVEAERIRSRFRDLEDLRDAWGPARVLHHALELAGVARTGPTPPFVSALSSDQGNRLRPVLQELLT